MIMAAPFPSGLSQNVQIFLPLTALFLCRESPALFLGSGERVGDRGEDGDGWDEGVPALPCTWLTAKDEGNVEGRWSPEPPPP